MANIERIQDSTKQTIGDNRVALVAKLVKLFANPDMAVWRGRVRVCLCDWVGSHAAVCVCQARWDAALGTSQPAQHGHRERDPVRYSRKHRLNSVEAAHNQADVHFQSSYADRSRIKKYLIKTLENYHLQILLILT
jgi:uncharacterized membrane protein YedE/YeeE